MHRTSQTANGVLGNEDRFDPKGHTAGKRVRDVGGIWSDRTHSLRKCVGSVGNFDQSLNTDRFIDLFGLT